MATSPVRFGTLADGREAGLVRLAWPGGLEVEVIEYGAIVRTLRARTPGGLVDAVLGLPDLSAYEADPGYQGRVVGRCANRIAGAAFVIDGERFEVTANEGPNCLHGGALGFSRRLWRFAAIDPEGRSAALTYDSPDGEEGFPGRVQAKTTFTLIDHATLEIAWEAVTDRPTPVNLTHHLYFNLSGDFERTILDHSLAIAASRMTPVQADLIPTGDLRSVEATAFDLRNPRRLGEVLDDGEPQLVLGGGIDHNWVLDGADGPAAVLMSPESGLVMSLTTDQPGLQVYSGQGLAAPFVAHGGIALEPQGFPDAVNRPDFPDVVLRPGQAYRRWARYRFAAGEADTGR
jgi:aldose 1-epimerase